MEITWTLCSSFHGRGYAREAAALALMEFDRIVGGPSACRIARDNDASHRLARLLGYREVSQLESSEATVAVLTRDPLPINRLDLVRVSEPSRC